MELGIPYKVDTQASCNAPVAWRVPAGFQRAHDVQNLCFHPLVTSLYQSEARTIAGTEDGRSENGMPLFETRRGDP